MAYLPTAADVEIVEQAAPTLDEEALMLRQSHCAPPSFTDWGDDHDAKESHDLMKMQVQSLYALAERMKL